MSAARLIAHATALLFPASAPGAGTTGLIALPTSGSQQQEMGEQHETWFDRIGGARPRLGRRG